MAKRKDDIKEVVEKMTSLAKLRFDPAKLGEFTQKARAVLSYVEKLGELDTSDIDPTSHAADMDTPLRRDEAVSSGMQEGILANAPARDEDFIQVPKVIEGE
jgi:aspartyl-tRNA(Asn)/glutamyl-tRNA(Gln) amidotransferase subunit C